MSHPSRDPTAALPLTHVAYHILVALASDDRHGYGIIKHLEQATDGNVRLEAGNLYAAIKRMLEEGWIRRAPNRPDEDARRRRYAISDFGRQVLAAESRRLAAMVTLAREAEVLPESTR